jgi:hypothetical protein
VSFFLLLLMLSCAAADLEVSAPLAAAAHELERSMRSLSLNRHLKARPSKDEVEASGILQDDDNNAAH